MRSAGGAGGAAVIELDERLDVGWTPGDIGRIPHRLYTDERVYQREHERLFYRSHWCYVGLVAEVPNPGDFKRTMVGERSVIMVRARDGAINVVENRCAHRGVQFCQAASGSTKTFVCPYHQWSYNLSGDLIGLPFRKGFKQGDRLNGGMPLDFEPAEHGLNKLRVAVYEGLVFASFDAEIEPFETFPTFSHTSIASSKAAN
jgi:salicylate 5-hydroxylase large subunit